MARVLIATWPFAGHLHPCLAVAHALRTRGHCVGFYTATAARALVQTEGFDFLPFDRLATRLQTIVDGRVPDTVGDDDAFYERLSARYSQQYNRKGLGRSRASHDMFAEWILGTVPEQVADLQHIVDHWRPDALVCDPMLWGPTLVLHEMRQLPVAVLCFYAGCLIPGRDAPPAGLDLPAPRTARTRLLAWSASRLVDLVGRDLRKTAIVIRGRYSLPPIGGSVLALGGRMPLYLVTTTPEYDYDRHDLPSSVHYVGSCLWDKPNRDAPPAWLSELAPDQPVVYVTEGTAQMRDATLLQTAVHGLGALPMQVIMTTGRHRDPALLGLEHVAPTIRVERFVPHSDLFPLLSAVVTTGGSGTVRAALQAGLPMVVVPREWDQFDNAQRIVNAGAGLRLSIGHCTPDALRRAVCRVLAEPSFRAAAERLGAASADSGGAGRAAELIEGLCRSVTPHTHAALTETVSVP